MRHSDGIILVITNYGLEDRVRFPECADFFIPLGQDRTRNHPAFYKNFINIEGTSLCLGLQFR
jgi:hypothetical protein